MLSAQALQEFKEIWKQEFGEEISSDLAIEEGINLLTMFNAVYRPIKEEWLSKINYERTTETKTL